MKLIFFIDLFLIFKRTLKKLKKHTSPLRTRTSNHDHQYFEIISVYKHD